MCLAKFAVNYEPIFDSKQVDEQTEGANDDDIEDNEDEMIRGRHNDVIVLNNNLGCMRKRRSESILRIKAFRQNTEPEKYYHSRLILYLPWRSEDELLGQYETYKDHYMQVSDVVEHNALGFYFHNDEMDAAINDVADNGPPEIVWDLIAPTIEENNIDALDDDCVIVCNVDSEEDEDEIHDLDVMLSGNDNGDQSQSRRNKLSTLFEWEACKDIMPNSEYRDHVRNLNECQHKVVMFN